MNLPIITALAVSVSTALRNSNLSRTRIANKYNDKTKPDSTYSGNTLSQEEREELRRRVRNGEIIKF